MDDCVGMIWAVLLSMQCFFCIANSFRVHFPLLLRVVWPLAFLSEH